MTHQRIDGLLFAQLIEHGARNLTRHAHRVDSLNVFPVPDGDTGTNMDLSFTSGVKEMGKTDSTHIGEVTKSLSKGLLMGARGNSGVILSQLFRGFAKHVEHEQSIRGQQFAQALQKGVDTAYKAVMKPVEGTILTVAKDAAQAAKQKARQSTDITEVMEAVVQEAKESLKRTPDLLPVLKQVGVVDSGGQGLVYVYEGFLSALKGEFDPVQEVETDQQEEYSFETNKAEHEEHVRHEVADMMAAGVLSVEDITYGYCTEFMIRLHPEQASAFQEPLFRDRLGRYGDSLLVISDEELVKIHIHAEELGKVLGLAQAYGELSNIKIENMREQFLAVQESRPDHDSGQAPNSQENTINDAGQVGPFPEEKKERKTFGIITVAMGEGIADIFKSLGADIIISGGQTMNPSTEDFVRAIEKVQAENVLILPNNGNVILAAEQAADVVDQPVSVIPSTNIPQGMAALISFNPSLNLADNESQMTAAKDEVKSGQVTHAVRDTEIEGIKIEKGQYMGILEGKIVAASPERQASAQQLLAEMIDEESEIVTLIYGEDVTAEQAEQIKQEIERQFGKVEVEVHRGGQPLYPYLISVE